MDKKFAILIIGVTAFSPAFILAQSGDAVADRRAGLQRELTYIESQIEEQRKILESKQKESVSLERDIAILNANIEKAKLNIKARDISIQKLSRDISDKEKLLTVLSSKLDREKESLAQLIRKTQELDSFSLVDVVLDNRNLSEFFVDVDSFESLNKALSNSFNVIKDNQLKTTVEKEDLEDARNEQSDLKSIQELEKRKIEKDQAEKSRILKVSKGIEAEYQKVLKSKEKDAARIRTELFSLRGSAAIPFDKALDYANLAGKKMGVRPALILGIIAEESNLGENVGTGNWRVDMKSPRDTDPFIDITRRLGLDPDKMPVSKKPWYGYGGAMGPAQFIPSTWIQMEDRIAKATGHTPPNPWDPGDAFMAAALYLSDAGAGKKTLAAERLAALRYLAGWSNATKKAYAFYGDDVMELATKYQKQIDILQGN